MRLGVCGLGAIRDLLGFRGFRGVRSELVFMVLGVRGQGG